MWAVQLKRSAPDAENHALPNVRESCRRGSSLQGEEWWVEELEVLL